MLDLSTPVHNVAFTLVLATSVEKEKGSAHATIVIFMFILWSVVCYAEI